MPHTIQEPAQDVPICHEADLCVVGGSTTGLFAAIAAARMGLSVAIIEAFGYFGGTATASLVNVWHSPFDETGNLTIMSGLGHECIQLLKSDDAVIDRGHNHSWTYAFSPYALVMALDQMLLAHPSIRPFLHARFVRPVMNGAGAAQAIIIEDKSGRRAIKAKAFIDASGDCDLAHRAGLQTYTRPKIQPPTTCIMVSGLTSTRQELLNAVFDPQFPDPLKPGFLWAAPMPGGALQMIAGTRAHGADCSDADQLTQAEFEGRRQARTILRRIKAHAPGQANVRLEGLPARIGIRESRHTRCLHQLTESEVLNCRRFDDAIANGSYRVDVHSAHGDGLTFRYLDGREHTVHSTGPGTHSTWRKEGLITSDAPRYYQVPYRSLVPIGSQNILVAGRCIDADEGAFGAMRVMVNSAQTGQAAGIAAALAVRHNTPVAQVNPQALRNTLGAQGATVL